LDQAIDLSVSDRKDSIQDAQERRPQVYLKNIHLKVNLDVGLLDCVESSLVQGPYYYYHYLHDDFDDAGWGCAYRSLQVYSFLFFFLPSCSILDN
jgi:hypothetical protein